MRTGITTSFQAGDSDLAKYNGGRNPNYSSELNDAQKLMGIK